VFWLVVDVTSWSRLHEKELPKKNINRGKARCHKNFQKNEIVERKLLKKSVTIDQFTVRWFHCVGLDWDALPRMLQWNRLM
jgi:hypothetical protein